MIPDKPTRCDRCGRIVDPDYFTEMEKHLFPVSYFDPFEGEEREILVCWECDWELMNGQGEPWDDPVEVQLRRAEEMRELYPIW